MFVPMYMITLGGPEMSTNLMMYEAYKSGFIYADFGRSYAIVTLILLVVICSGHGRDESSEAKALRKRRKNMKKRTVKHVLFGTVAVWADAVLCRISCAAGIFSLLCRLSGPVRRYLNMLRPSRCPPLSPDRYPWNPSGVCLLIMSS